MLGQESTSSSPDLTPALDAAKAKEQVTLACRDECQHLAQEVEQQQFSDCAKQFNDVFGIAHQAITQAVIQKYQAEFCAPAGIDIMDLSHKEILALIQTEVETQIALTKEQQAGTDIAQSEQKLDSDISDLAHSVTERKENITDTAQTEKRLDSDIAQQTQTIEQKDSQIAALAEALQSAGTHNLSSLATLYDDIADDGVFIGKEGKAVSLDTQTQKAMLEQLSSVLDTLNVIQAHFRPDEQHLIQNAEINLAGNSTREVYAGVFETIESGIIDVERKKELTEIIKKELRLDVMAKTGSDIQRAYDQGHGLDTNGEVIPFTEKHPAKRDTMLLYEKPNGKRVVDLPLVGSGRHIKIQFPANATGEDVGEAVFTGQVVFACENLALAQPIFQRGLKIAHGGVIDIHYDDIIKAKKSASFLLGGVAGYDGTLLDSGDIHRLKKSFQALRRRGDAATGDNDAAAATLDYQELGIVNDDGHINWAVFERACDFIQTQKSKGVVPEFEGVKAYLNQLATG